MVAVAVSAVKDEGAVRVVNVKAVVEVLDLVHEGL